MLATRKEHIQALVGRTIGGKYRIQRLLGTGGMGAVYEATNLAINKRVALKFLFRDDTLDADTVARFQREAEAASAISSDHIVQVFDAGSDDDGRPYLVMELLDGEDLRHKLKREGTLALPVIAEVAEQLLRALGRAHGAGIVHRDLKPDNIYICRRDDRSLFVKIVDFGISKVINENLNTLTREGTVLGTAHYMAPEQAQALPDIDGRADLFSLGAIIYEALAGRPPHLARTYEAVLILACTKPAPDIRVFAPDVPPALAQVIAKSIARDRNDRFGTAQEFADALRAALSAPGTAASDSKFGSSVSADSALADTERLLAPAGLPADTPSTQGDDDTPSPPGSFVPTETAGNAMTRRQRPPGRFVIGVAAVVAIFGIVALGLIGNGRNSNETPPLPSANALTSARAAPKLPLTSARPKAPSPPDPSSLASAERAARPPAAGVSQRSTPPSGAAATPMVASAAPTPTETGSPTPAGSGVAGQLQLKTEGP